MIHEIKYRELRNSIVRSGCLVVGGGGGVVVSSIVEMENGGERETVA